MICNVCGEECEDSLTCQVCGQECCPACCGVICVECDDE